MLLDVIARAAKPVPRVRALLARGVANDDTRDAVGKTRCISPPSAATSSSSSGEFADFADMARQLGFTRARVTQLMDLLLLAPEVQEEVLFLELPPGAQPVSERGLREAVLGTVDWQEQRRRWDGLRAQSTRWGLNGR